MPLTTTIQAYPPGPRADIIAAAVDSDRGSSFVTLHIPTGADATFNIACKMPHGGTITEITTISRSGTATGTTKINSTAVTGTTNAISSTRDSQVPTAANVFVAGDDLNITLASNSSLVQATVLVKYTRVP